MRHGLCTRCPGRPRRRQPCEHTPQTGAVRGKVARPGSCKHDIASVHNRLPPVLCLSPVPSDLGHPSATAARAPCGAGARVRGPWRRGLLRQAQSTPEAHREYGGVGGSLQTKPTLLMVSATLPKPQIFCGKTHSGLRWGPKHKRGLEGENWLREPVGGGAHPTRRIGVGGGRVGRRRKTESLSPFPATTAGLQGRAGSAAAAPRAGGSASVCWVTIYVRGKH